MPVVIAVSLTLIYFLSPSVESDEVLIGRARDVFGRIEPALVNTDQIKLGSKLFFDKSLSKSGKISCASCHRTDSYGADNQSYSVGVDQTRTTHNTPSIFNLRYQHYFNWRLSGKNLEVQTERSFFGPNGLGHLQNQKLQMLKKTDIEALVAFQESLVTPSPFDRYLAGEKNALNESQKAGFRLFMKLGCVSCHNGPGIGGRDFQRFGLTQDYWLVTGSEIKDQGLKEITGRENDKNVFKVPSLRNVAKTAPYFHDGSAKDLTTAVRWMAQLQLDEELTSSEIDSLVRFLESLTGEIPKAFMQ